MPHQMLGEEVVSFSLMVLLWNAVCLSTFIHAVFMYIHLKNVYQLFLYCNFYVASINESALHFLSICQTVLLVYVWILRGICPCKVSTT